MMMPDDQLPIDSDELEQLETIDDAVIDIMAQDRCPSGAENVKIDEIVARSGELLYSNLVYVLTGLRFAEPHARERWGQILEHKYKLSQLLGRNVGIRVASLDYFQNVTGELQHTRIRSAERVQQTAQSLAQDTFTNTYTKSFILDLLARELAAAKKNGSPVALFFFDIDHFKQYNDMNGHLAGDVVLLEVVAITRRLIPASAALGRFGGEEFIVVLPGHDRASALALAERVREAIARHDIPNREKMPGWVISVSGGVAAYPRDEQTPDGLVELADGLLYRAKRLGRNRIEVMA